MSRLGLIARNPKTALGGIATLMVAAGLTVGSGAFVADQAASEGNSVEAGTADIQVFGSSQPVLDGNNCRQAGDAFIDASADPEADCNIANTDTNPAREEKATFTITNMSPGQPAIVRCFTVKNVGDVPLATRLDVDSISGSSDLSQALKLRIARSATGATRIADNYLSDLATFAPRIADYKTQLGESAPTPNSRVALEPGATSRYCVTATLRDTGAPQPEIEGDTVGFAVNVLAQSVYGSGLDAERSAFATNQ